MRCHAIVTVCHAAPILTTDAAYLLTQKRNPLKPLLRTSKAAPKPARIPPTWPAESVPEPGRKMAPYASYAKIPPIMAHAGKGRTKKRRNCCVGKRAP